MILNTIHRDLKDLYKNETDLYNSLGFTFTIEDETKRIINLFKRGYWSIMPFAFDNYDSYAIKIHPQNKINNSAIVYFKRGDGLTIASSLKTFLPLYLSENLRNIKVINNHFLDKKEIIKEMSLPYSEQVSSLDSLDFLYSYITNSDNLKRIEKQDEDYHRKTYLDFWNHYNDTPQQKKYSDLMIQLNTDENFYPEFKEVDYGLWNIRAYNALAERAYVDYDAEFKKREPHVWKSLIQPHGFDALSGGFGIIPNPSSDSSRSKLGVIDEFDTHPDLKHEFSKEVLGHPLYEAIQDLRVRQRGYMGEKHIEAAAILDTKHNDPYASWDALVTASYWAGQAGSKAIEPMWEAAIYLAEKHNWTEIHEVLVQQYEYYNFYKDKV